MRAQPLLTKESQLLKRAQSLAGLTIQSLADAYKQSVPHNLLNSKGWVGQLLEIALGAEAGNAAKPDFPDLGIELKTIPVNATGQPIESTYVCTAPLGGFEAQWRESRVYAKIARVLWVPIQADLSIALPDRRIGQAFLWSPDPATEAILQKDWEELTELLSIGEYASLSAQLGTYLQLRPKAANASVQAQPVDGEGHSVRVVPKGFYLRPSFTRQILAAYFGDVAGAH